MYQVRLLEPAIKALAKLDKPVARRVTQRLNWLAENFDSIRPFPLSGNLAGFYKFRVGDYRIIYEVLQTEHLIIVHLIGHRREVYH